MLNEGEDNLLGTMSSWMMSIMLIFKNLLCRFTTSTPERKNDRQISATKSHLRLSLRFFIWRPSSLTQFTQKSWGDDAATYANKKIKIFYCKTLFLKHFYADWKRLSRKKIPLQGVKLKNGPREKKHFKLFTKVGKKTFPK